MSRRVVIDIKQIVLHSISIDLDDYDDEVAEAFENQDADYFSEFTEDLRVCDSDTDWTWE